LLRADDLRAKVKALIPAFHKLRDLGGSLMPEGISAAADERLLIYLRRFEGKIITAMSSSRFRDRMNGRVEFANCARKKGGPFFPGVTFKQFLDDPESRAEVEEIEKVIGQSVSSIRIDEYCLVRGEPDVAAANAGSN
jgi:hypothetical protein